MAIFNNHLIIRRLEGLQTTTNKTQIVKLNLRCLFISPLDIRVEILNGLFFLINNNFGIRIEFTNKLKTVVPR